MTLDDLHTTVMHSVKPYQLSNVSWCRVLRRVGLFLTYLLINFVLDNSAGDKASSQDEADVASEEFKLKTYCQAGKIKEAERTNTLRTQQNSYQLGEDVSEFGCNKERSSSIVDDRLGEDETQPLKPHSHLPSVIQRRETVTQFQGVTPVKLSRRELRHIPPSELSLRRSSLGAGVSFIAPDSIEMNKK